MTRKPVCVVVGVGPGNGAAIARRFADAGYCVALLARTVDFASQLAKVLTDARAIPCDITSVDDVAQSFARIRSELGEVAVLVYNAGAGTWGTIEQTSASEFEASWKVNALGSFLAAKEVIPAMKVAGSGCIVLISATASRRGRAGTTAFAAAKAAQRSLAESMAKHLWPSGIHVALLVIDGIVDLPGARAKMPGKDDSFFVKPEAIAESVYQLCAQDRSAWSFEVEARPFGEVW